jgi:NAD(P)-dependent dehydrogenase (short-subunit alcohol dehydrogenase family)
VKAVVIGGGPGVAALASGLLGPSSTVGSIDWDAAAGDKPARRSALAARMSGSDTGPAYDLIVILVEPSPASPLSALDEALWQAECEMRLWLARTALQLGHRAVRHGGGRLVFVLSAAALSGSCGSLASATVAEGVRALAKSAATAWAAEDITVNCLAIAPALLSSDILLRDQVAPLVLSLAGCGPLVNGSTLVADGGASMFL